MNSPPTAIGMVVITLAAALGGCVAIDEGGDQSIPVTKAVLPTTVQPYRRIDETLFCIRQVHACLDNPVRNFCLGRTCRRSERGE